MSTQGAGSAEVSAAVFAGAAVLVIGAGILIVNGVMWCGDQLEKHYQNALREWANLRQAAFEEARSNREWQVSHVLQLMSANERALPGHDQVHAYLPAQPDSAALAASAKALRAALDADLPPDDIDRQVLAATLQREIAAGQGKLPAATLQMAQQALSGSAATMQQALTTLRSAWDALSDARLQRERLVSQIRWQVLDAAAQLRTLGVLAQQNGIAAAPQQTAAITRTLTEAELRLAANDLAGAQTLAQQGQDATTALARAVTNAVAIAWADVQGALATLQGKLDALQRILTDAKALQLADAANLDHLDATLATTQREAERLARQRDPVNARELEVLRAKVELAERDVFATTKQGQQRQLATIVSETLGELGYHSADGQAPAVRASGGFAHIDAVPASERAARTGRRVTFDVSVEGEVAYDFQGYVGTTCEDDAREIFTALRKRGILLRDRYSGEEIQEAEQNKRQARLYERLKTVLQNMHFTNIHETFAAGMIELEAFNGDIGYRVTLAPAEDEQPEVLRNHQDVSADARDPIVAAIQADAASQPTPPPTRTRSQAATQQQQRLEH